MKDYFFQLYSRLTQKLFPYEHLSHMVNAVTSRDEQSLQLASIYTTGLYNNDLVTLNTLANEVVDLEKEVFDIQDNIPPTIKEDVAPTFGNSTNITNETKESNDLKDTIIDPIATIGQTQSSDQVHMETEDSDMPLKEDTESAILWENEDGNLTDPIIETPDHISIGKDPIQAGELDTIDEINGMTSSPETEPSEDEMIVEHTYSTTEKKEKKKQKKKAKAKLKKYKKKKESHNETAKSIDTEGFSDFNKWLSGLQQLEGSQFGHEDDITPTKVSRKRKKKKKKKLTKVELSAKESITRDEGLATETLALVLTSQGHLDQAIDMYTKLAKMHPEKAQHFNEKASELRKRLD